MAERRSTFGPVVVAGLASAGLLAWAGGRAWVEADGAERSPGTIAVAGDQTASSPLATALALVVLACWGVLLVSRGRLRRGIALLALVAALGAAVTVAAAPFVLPDQLRDRVRRDTGLALDATGLTGWYWLAALAAMVAVIATVAAVVLARAWPEMSSRYDAPDGAAVPAPAAAPTDNTDIWKALDEGRDPTA